MLEMKDYQNTQIIQELMSTIGEEKQDPRTLFELQESKMPKLMHNVIDSCLSSPRTISSPRPDREYKEILHQENLRVDTLMSGERYGSDAPIETEMNLETTPAYMN